MRISRPAAFGIGALTALVLGTGTAYAATGGTFVLGHSNSATSTTVLKNTRGTALSLSSRPGTPSLKVSNSAKVPNLNADRLDGYDGKAFSLASGQTNTISRTGVSASMSPATASTTRWWLSRPAPPAPSSPGAAVTTTPATVSSS